MPESKPKKSAARDVDKRYPRARFIEKLRRLADALEQDQRFVIQVAGERITVPADAVVSVEHERSAGEHELEFQLRWRDTEPGATAPATGPRTRRGRARP